MSKLEPRDYKDLERDDIAVYNFRGYTVIRFWKRDAEDGKRGKLVFGDEANMCRFITEDLKGMADFLHQCYMYCQKDSDIKNVDHVEVN